MENFTEIVDETLGRLSPVGESAYLAEVSWNRDLRIRLFIHFDGGNHQKSIEKAKKILFLIRKKEIELFNQGVDYLASIGAICPDEDDLEVFLGDAAEISIEIYPNGEGRLVYFVIMLGTIIVQFSSDFMFQNAEVMAG
jgi:hypothetical protein